MNLTMCDCQRGNNLSFVFIIEVLARVVHYIEWCLWYFGPLVYVNDVGIILKTPLKLNTGNHNLNSKHDS